MNYRRAIVLAEEAASTAGTKTIDLDLTDPISRLIIRMRCTNAATKATLTGHPASMLSKIELVDGSDVIFSLGGHEAQALNAYEELVTPDTEIIDGNGDNQWCSWHLNFGRYLWDKELALDPTRFKNPQLKITHNYRSFVADAVAGYLLVHAQIFDEKRVAPIGFLMSKEIEDITLAGTAYKYTDIPTDHPIRKLLLRAYLTNKAVNGQVSEIRLSEDVEKKIPLDVDMDQYLREMMGVWPPLIEHFQLRVVTAVASVYVMPTYWPMQFGMLQTANDWWKGGYFEAERQGLDAATDQTSPFMGMTYGYVPHHTVEFPFGLQDDLADWYDATKLNRLRARLKGVSGSTAVCTWFMQQLRRY